MEKDNPAQKYWLVIASADHIETAVKGGFIQAGHGKLSPVAKFSKGDGLICYATKEVFGGNKACQKFLAIGEIADALPKQKEQAANFKPYRRKVSYHKDATPVAIKPLLSRLHFIKDVESWGLSVRRSLVELDEHDFKLIEGEML